MPSSERTSDSAAAGTLPATKKGGPGAPVKAANGLARGGFLTSTPVNSTTSTPRKLIEASDFSKRLGAKPAARSVVPSSATPPTQPTGPGATTLMGDMDLNDQLNASLTGNNDDDGRATLKRKPSKEKANETSLGVKKRKGGD